MLRSKALRLDWCDRSCAVPGVIEHGAETEIGALPSVGCITAGEIQRNRSPHLLRQQNLLARRDRTSPLRKYPVHCHQASVIRTWYCRSAGDAMQQRIASLAIGHRCGNTWRSATTSITSAVTAGETTGTSRRHCFHHRSGKLTRTHSSTSAKVHCRSATCE